VLYPSWSGSGRTVVYVTWDDQALGSVRMVPMDGNEGRVLTAEPGHYVEPTISPDGRHVVYRKTGGGFITSPHHAEEQGLYVVPISADAEPRLLEENGYAPHFADGAERVYFTTFEAEDRRALRSLQLDGLEPRHHATSDAATEYRVSPDGRWLAWAERYKVHLVPFLASAKPLQLGPGASSVPLAEVAKNAGEYLHWSGDASKLHWSLGAELYTRELTDAFAFLEGAPEELPDPVAEGAAIGFEVETAEPAGKIALVGGRVLTMARDADGRDVVYPDGVIVTDGPRLLAVGPRAEVEVPADATVIDVAGKTLVPGFVDVHWHGSQGTSEIQPQQNWFNYASLAFGVTTVHDPSNDTSTFFAASEMQKAGEIVAPRLYSTGTILYGAAGSFKAEIDSLDDARFHLERMKAVGAWSVKSYNQPRRDQRQQVIAAAKELEMEVMPEGGSLFMHNMNQVVDGHTGIEHAIPLARLYDDVVQLWGATDVAYTPTMGVGYGGIWGENYWYAKTDVWANERLLTFVPREFVDPVARRPFHAPDEEYNHISIAEGCKQLGDAGVLVTVGAHGQREGLAVHWEMWMLEQGGMTPMEALRAGTWNGAAYLGLEGDIGSLEAGKLADLAVIEGDPLEDLRRSEKVSHVMVNGRLYDAATMSQIAPEQVEREPFFFERNREPLVSAGR
ncbi:MAG: amidohydrolase family protein, partial [Holophagales bacterium]|nr:amidohydrolase family protein [Holophagales bacterium]